MIRYDPESRKVLDSLSELITSMQRKLKKQQFATRIALELAQKWIIHAETGGKGTAKERRDQQKDMHLVANRLGKLNKLLGNEVPEGGLPDEVSEDLNFEEPYQCGHQRWPGENHCPCRRQKDDHDAWSIFR